MAILVKSYEIMMINQWIWVYHGVAYFQSNPYEKISPTDGIAPS